MFGLHLKMVKFSGGLRMATPQNLIMDQDPEKHINRWFELYVDEIKESRSDIIEYR